MDIDIHSSSAYDPTSRNWIEGYRAFGTADPEVMELQETGWPELEVTRGVFLIEIRMYGDSPEDAFISVSAVSEALAVEVWNRTRERWMGLRKAIWDA